MSDVKQPRSRTIVSAASVLRMPPHIKLRHEAGRGRWIILGPERVFEPDEPAVAVLKRCDGVRSVTQIVQELSKEYDAPAAEIETDVIGMFQELADKGVVVAA
ncbi:MAG: pyrroloquinoline quinone biosynthesis peptide chaperone PqqD [Hyphomicrobiaceae bacterium]|nr:pyrroloquinoline quinone biosynthesis peptide chaperone PqqD [Hyphomicrobiaceae bacterium]